MKRNRHLDVIDKNILRILDLYGSLGVEELWYEIGEDDISKDNMTEEEVSSRLRSLSEEGLVKCIRDAEGVDKWAIDPS